MTEIKEMTYLFIKPLHLLLLRCFPSGWSWKKIVAFSFLHIVGSSSVNIRLKFGKDLEQVIYLCSLGSLKEYDITYVR
jgi:hypothetical protein